MPKDPPAAADEHAHPDVAVEAWWWWAWQADAAAGLFVGLELRGERFDYWAGVVRDSQPYLYVAELDGLGRRHGLELKPPELWADHQCDVPMRQWSVANEAYGVLLDDPDEAWRRAYGDRVPVAMDIEWAATAAPVAIANGYSQSGEADVVVELSGGPLRWSGPASRVHVWGVPYVPADLAVPVSARRAPLRRSDGRLVDQVLTTAGWHARTVAG